MRARSIYSMLGGAAFAAATLLANHSALAEVPETLTQTGRLFDSNMNPITAQLQVTLAIYDSATDPTPLWTEKHTVSFQDGYFVLEMGSVSLFTANIFDGTVRYVGITIGTDAELTPRAPLSSAPFVLFAGDVNGNVTPKSVSIGTTPVIDATGKWVGPVGKLSGPTGAMGPIGPKGPTGAAGTTAGPAGATGATGRGGDTGLAGPHGPPGLPGTVGPTGHMGPIGKTGLTGGLGVTGIVGNVGLTGATGANGPMGPAGINGLSGGVQGVLAKFVDGSDAISSNLSGLGALSTASGPVAPTLAIGPVLPLYDGTTATSQYQDQPGAPPVLNINAQSMPLSANYAGVVTAINITLPNNEFDQAGDGYWVIYGHDTNTSSGQTLPGGEGGVWLGRDYDYNITNEVGVQFGSASNTGVGLFTSNNVASFRVEATGSCRVGAIAAFAPTTGILVTGSGPGVPMLMSGGPLETGMTDGENTDTIFWGRYNVAPNVTELRVNVGDDGDGTNTAIMDDFVVGNIAGGGSDPSSFEPKFKVRSDGELLLWNGIVQGGCTAPFNAATDAASGATLCGTSSASAANTPCINPICVTALQPAATFDAAEATCQAAGAHVVTPTEFINLKAQSSSGVTATTDNNAWLGARVCAPNTANPNVYAVTTCVGTALYNSSANGEAVDTTAHTNLRPFRCALSSTYEP